MSGARACPRIIWVLWLQGWDDAPELVRACVRTWECRNPGWTLNRLDRGSLGRYIDLDALVGRGWAERMEPEAQSDLVRAALLETYGGVWVDATLYCLRPLDSWLPPAAASGFFAFAKPGPDRMLSSWFLAASAGSYVGREWARRAVAYWRTNARRRDYFWFHYLFGELYRDDPAFRAAWDAIPEVLADLPHLLAPYEKLALPLAPDAREILDSGATPVLKLTHKLGPGPFGPDSALAELLRAAADLGPAARAPRALRLLVAWYGSLEGSGTIGDLLSMEAVVGRLRAEGHEVRHASAEPLHVPGSDRVDWQRAAAGDYDALVFVCGPLMASHPGTRALLERFAGTRRIGIGVSLFPEGHPDRYAPFDRVLAREGGAEAWGDVAIAAAPSASPPVIRRDRRGGPRIGLALRGRQLEYGESNCLWAWTERVALGAAEALVRRAGGEIILIENHLRASGKTRDAIEAEYAGCDLVITSRFHGAQLAARHLVPFIALDQVRGGAKVLRLLAGKGWPHVYPAEGMTARALTRIARRVLAGEDRSGLAAFRTRAVREANECLGALIDGLRTAGEGV